MTGVQTCALPILYYCTSHFRCDSRCHYFGECCFDAPEPGPDFKKPEEILTYKCVPPGSASQSTQGYALISTCPTGSESIRNTLCNDAVYGNWSSLSWPVYDDHTNLR